MYEFVMTLKEFFGEFYPGRLTLVLPDTNHGTMAIDCEALALFIKGLLCEICDGTPLSVVVDTKESFVRVDLSAGETFREQLTRYPKIMRLAKQSGFYTTYTDRGVMLSLPLNFDTGFFIHAINVDDFYSILKHVFKDV